MSKKGTLFVISGPSGVGKGTLKEVLLAELAGIKLSISVTTRKPRVGEVDGRDYFFVSEETFKELILEDKLLEWAKVYTNMYGTPRDFVLENLNQGQDILLEIDIQGALQIKKKMPDGVFIFISPPSIEELGLRLYSRGKDSQESINIRLAACKDELKYSKHYNYIVVNDNISEAVDKLKSIIVAERCKIEKLD
ncbi:MAG: guanylate kinase [Syntrophomonadaceae bacterium]|nr:guanylate kinase [Syntrophomonadaceae bacterium]MDD3888328.1 guanylate kinase [Syntrophomonadaceae bacterium]MDD4548835.1 guanylate kinase [Syntrophomonadaceae bacterium]